MKKYNSREEASENLQSGQITVFRCGGADQEDVRQFGYFICQNRDEANKLDLEYYDDKYADDDIAILAKKIITRVTGKDCSDATTGLLMQVSGFTEINKFTLPELETIIKWRTSQKTIDD